MFNPHVLMVLTSHNRLGDTGELTGFWLEEFAAPYYAFVDAGAQVTLASIQGGQPPIDPKSDGEDAQTDATQRFRDDAIAQEALSQTQPIDQLQSEAYDAIFLPGGHGTMWDFPVSSALTQLIESFNKEGKVIAAVCHAPAALVNVKDLAGSPLVQGKSVTAFTNSEEAGVQLEAIVPFLLESKLRDLGAAFKGAADWSAHVETDGMLITGQNPASSEPTAQAVIETLKATVA